MRFFKFFYYPLKNELNSRSCTTFLVAMACSGIAMSHIPAYEGERVRNDNHFVKEGFAEPVRGECDINAVGPTDSDAGSANIYLSGGNIPPNFFCAFTTQDDWSFSKPVDIIESSRVPSPDPRDLGAPLEEGYIPCSPVNPNPFQCPRQIANPQNNTVINLPGECIDVGQPGDPAESDYADGEYHCALLPGAPRPRESSVFFSTLTGSHDVDWGIYKYDPVFGEQPIVGAPQVPACKENLKAFVTFAYAGPLNMLDARSGQPVFKPVSDIKYLPKDVKDNIPDGYGIRVTRPDTFSPDEHNPRLGYASGFAQNAWLLAPDSVVECIDNFEKCLADETGELSKHYNGNDIFFINENQPIDLYLMWWVDSDKSKGKKHHKKKSSRLIDASMTTGVVDQFIVGDFINIGVSGPFSGNGRYVHGKCTDPRSDGAADIVIEINQ